MDVAIGRATPSAMAAVRDLVDDVFVHSRGATLSLARRLPHVLDDANAGNVFVARDDARIVGVVATRPFTWIAGSERWPAAMVGVVSTAPEERGRGVASAVLREVERALREAGAAFAVLWTTQHGFYERLGWRAGDTGVLGTTAGSGERRGHGGVSLDPALIEALDSIRRRFEPERVERVAGHWHVLPAPAEALHPVVEDEAYALVGTAGDSAYVYELVGDARSYAGIWSRVRALAPHVLVNDARRTRSYTWLANEGVTWRDQRLTMWLPLGARASDVPTRGWHVPWLDRI